MVAPVDSLQSVLGCLIERKRARAAKETADHADSQRRRAERNAAEEAVKRLVRDKYMQHLYNSAGVIDTLILEAVRRDDWDNLGLEEQGRILSDPRMRYERFIDIDEHFVFSLPAPVQRSALEDDCGNVAEEEKLACIRQWLSSRYGSLIELSDVAVEQIHGHAGSVRSRYKYFIRW